MPERGFQSTGSSIGKNSASPFYHSKETPTALTATSAAVRTQQVYCCEDLPYPSMRCSPRRETGQNARSDRVRCPASEIHELVCPILVFVAHRAVRPANLDAKQGTEERSSLRFRQLLRTTRHVNPSQPLDHPQPPVV